METGYNSTFGATSPHGPRLLLYQQWWADCCLPRPPAAGPHGSARLVLFSPTLICGRVLAPRLHATRCLAPSVFAGEAGGPAPGQSSALDPCLPASGPALWGFCLAQPRKTHSLPASFLSRLSGHSICPLGPSLAVLSRLWETKKWLHASEHLRPRLRMAFGIPEGEKGGGTQERTFRWTLQIRPAAPAQWRLVQGLAHVSLVGRAGVVCVCPCSRETREVSRWHSSASVLGRGLCLSPDQRRGLR